MTLSKVGAHMNEEETGIVESLQRRGILDSECEIILEGEPDDNDD